MLYNKGFFALLVAATVGLTACVPPPPRQTVVYHESSDEGSSSRYCQTCGTIRDIARVDIQQGTTGGGAVLGAIIGGLIGNQFGGGSGKAAMTAAGVVGGAAVGNAVEADSAHHASGMAWRYRVQLDDGRMATVTQYDNPGYHPGNRVVIRGDHIEALRE
jgi:outer membrane lipoprotein SlyB